MRRAPPPPPAPLTTPPVPDFLPPPPRPAGGKESIARDAVKQHRLKNVLWNHWLPPLPSTGAVWTAPFLAQQQGAALPSLGGPEAVVVEWVDAATGHVGVKGPRSSAKIYKQDIYACKVRALPVTPRRPVTAPSEVRQRN